eukprot:CAMPEP_0178891500 /NCGR_PEP_ID=MMETSP0747-20121128/18975_1 /TAXON_ID=913974 /ORGANISM="Nitzschia punctata, Strain CCMP561" /LENGTH=112 /DNA_ID=CAMNT_0020561355 /DNA_START=202 /DNA_END=540 /DNA_ORIENTATION=+
MNVVVLKAISSSAWKTLSTLSLETTAVFSNDEEKSCCSPLFVIMYTTAPMTTAADNNRKRKQYRALLIRRSSADATMPSLEPEVPVLVLAALELELSSMDELPPLEMSSPLE